MSEEAFKITPDEMKMLIMMRRYGPSASFRIEKRVSKQCPNGELLKVVAEMRHSLRIVELKSGHVEI